MMLQHRVFFPLRCQNSDELGWDEFNNIGISFYDGYNESVVIGGK